MASATSTVLCEPCEHNGISKQAKHWCNDCGEGFCDKCIKAHQVTKILRGHHVISVEDYNKVADLQIEELCERHKTPYEFFCKQHDAILCLQCFQSEHNTCEISGLDQAAVGSKTSTALTDLENDIRSVIENLGKAIENASKSVVDLTANERAVRQKIQETRNSLNKVLDRLQGTILKELSVKYESCKTKLESYNGKLLETKNRFNEIRDKLCSVKQYMSDRQAFVGIRTISVDVQGAKEDIAKVSKDQSKFKIEIKVCHDVATFLEKEKPFGQIVVESDHNHIYYLEPTILKAQRRVESSQCFENIRLDQTRVILIKQGTEKMSLTACAILPNTSLVFVDNNNNRLIVHTHEGKHITDIRVPGRPFDITALSSNRIAISYPDRKVDVLNLDNKKTETIAGCFRSNYYGITSHDGNIYVLSYGKEIVICNENGEISKRIPFNIEEVYNIDVIRDNIYYSNPNGNYVKACDFSGKLIWEVKDIRICRSKLFLNYYSLPLTTDNHDNVFVTLPDSDSVLLISSDGQKKRVILDKSNGIEQPSGISFQPESEKLLVCSITTGKAWIFQLTYRN